MGVHVLGVCGQKKKQWEAVAPFVSQLYITQTEEKHNHTV